MTKHTKGEETMNYYEMVMNVSRSISLRAVAALVVMVMLLAGPLPAQEQLEKKKDYGNQTEEYCTVYAVGKEFSTKWKVEVDFGQKFEWSLRNKDLLRGPDGKMMKFDSPVDAINYLNASGWTVVSAYGNDEYLGALMKRPVRR